MNSFKRVTAHRRDRRTDRTLWFVFRVLLYNGRTDNMWEACGDKIKAFPMSCQCLTHILPSPTKYLHFACGESIEAMWGLCWEHVDCSKLSVHNMCIQFLIGLMWARYWNYLLLLKSNKLVKCCVGWMLTRCWVGRMLTRSWFSLIVTKIWQHIGGWQLVEWAKC